MPPELQFSPLETESLSSDLKMGLALGLALIRLLWRE